MFSDQLFIKFRIKFNKDRNAFAQNKLHKLADLERNSLKGMVYCRSYVRSSIDRNDFNSSIYILTVNSHPLDVTTFLQGFESWWVLLLFLFINHRRMLP